MSGKSPEPSAAADLERLTRHQRFLSLLEGFNPNSATLDPIYGNV
jgi:hypothetical protein